ncbi:hypothetical protein [Escherichia coli]
MISLSPPTICNSALPHYPEEHINLTGEYRWQSRSVGFRPFPQTTPNRKRS